MDKTYLRLPEYLKRPIAKLDDIENKNVRNILSKYHLNTVCENARCPNKTQCWGECTATFLIMGKVCTRNCRFCNITSDNP
ncbi:TPA: lipoyl synthase, partial [Candidatus Galligastranaerophilus gallistercoris]|nr:lipoyl synthase [Candidatus Galligastranaerophilus gallistercoris]